MNKINPIYILGFFVLVLVVMIFQNFSIRNTIVETTQQVSSVKQNGQAIASLKKHWKNPVQSQKSIDALLNHRDFKANVLKQEKKANSYKISLHNLDARKLDKFVGKVLNEYVILKKITINRVAENNISMRMEIEL